MKPLYLELSAFGAFGGVEVIDFTKIPPGLFLICGETGAGKTTIFDAISYALYGKMSGSIRDAKTARSHFADESNATYVKFKFLYRNKKYEILRSPSYKRKKFSGEGETTEKGKVVLTLPDGNVIYDERAVRAKITDLLALNHSQWKQIAMIAQGEFTKCLHAESDERSAIFRNIFETGIYERLSACLKENELSARRKCEQAVNNIFQFLKTVICDKSSQLYFEFIDALENRTIVGAKKANEVVRRLVSADFDILERLDSECAAIQKLLDKNNSALENAKAVNKNIAELKKETAFREELLKNTTSIEEREVFARSAEGALSELTELEEQLVRHDSAALTKESIKKLESEISQNEGYLQTVIRRREELTESQKKNEAVLEAYKDVRIKLLERANELTRAEEHIAALIAATEDIARYNRLRSDYKAVKADCVAKKKASGKMEEELSEKRRAFIRGYAGIVAKELSPGDPCPVCGSKHHPDKAVITDGIPTEAEINALEKAVSDALSKWHEAEAALKGKEAEGLEIKKTIIKNAGKYIESATDKQISDIYNDILCVSDETKQKAQQLKSEITMLKRDEKSLEASEKKQKEIADAILNLNTQEKERQDEINRIKTILAQKRGEHNEIRKSLRHNSKDEAALQIDGVMLKLNVKPRSGQSAAEAVSLALTVAKSEIDTHKSSVMLSNAKIDTLAKLSAGRELIDLQRLETEISALKAAKASKDLERSERWLAYKSNSAVYKKLEESVAEAEKEERWYGIVERLSKTANGEIKGKQKITLEMYVQRAYFHKIIKSANLRLIKMTSGRFELMRKRSAASLKDKSFALDLDVLDNNTGKVRDISSLSGGETFMAALSLALALSDTIQSEAGGVEIQTMFIDEGFGSLSPEFLSLVMNTLNSMAYDNNSDKYIGVISHIDELKGGILKQIHIKKSAHGGSGLYMI